MTSEHDFTTTSDSTFNPYEKEQQLRDESKTWDTLNIANAEPGDIPVINLGDYFTTGSNEALKQAAVQLKDACANVGFFSIVGHGVLTPQIEEMFSMVRAFHDLPIETKKTILMDRPGWPVGGIGYLPVKNRKLPARDKGNLNEAFIIKRDGAITMQENQWLDDSSLPGFRHAVEQYASAMERLGKRMLPIYASALDMPTTFFDEAFVSPMYRLRMTRYPPVPPSDSFGIAPHVDTTFCTILAQDSAGLSIFSERKQKWIKAPLIKDAFIVNSGELLKHWTNDRFLSVKHFANNNTSNNSRYSIPFFLNANSNCTMTCIPSCCGPDNPAKYPPISYAESQAVAQGE